MRKRKAPGSLRGKMLGIVTLGWLVPVVLVLAVMGFYMRNTLGQHTTDNLQEQLAMNLSMSADRLDMTLSASRAASFNATIKTAWSAYGRNGDYAALYRAASGFMNSQYRGDTRFTMAAFWFAEAPTEMRVTLHNEAVGVWKPDFWKKDWPAAVAAARELDTGFVYLVCEDRVYLVRNVVNSDFQVIGTLALGVYPDYCFSEVKALAFASDATVYLEGQPVVVKGEPFADDGRWGKEYLSAAAQQREYRLEVVALLDRAALTDQMAGYWYILAGMLLLIVPLLALVLWFFNKKVNRPVEMLMEGAGQVEQGELGYQISQMPDSREFSYLTDSFNRMSGQLRHQFDRLYQEEMALRDAEIKALQAHINPHFLNNTLEIINWEARMAGSAKVSKMIEALATVLDAALDREKRPKVCLAQEMSYVNAYLYIISERYGKRLAVTVDLAEELMNCLVPRLILQPVIENAVEHGVGPGGQGQVSIKGRREGAFLLLDIENHGGLTWEDREKIDALLSADHSTMKQACQSIGIANVNQRLAILYGPTCGLRIWQEGEKRVVARLTIALEEENRGVETEK